MSTRGRPPAEIRTSVKLAQLVKSNDIGRARSLADQVLARQERRDAALSAERGAKLCDRTEPDLRRH
jgi:hypothetical protein